MSLTLEEKLKIFNWFYALGKPLVSDIEYNRMFQELKKNNPESEVITKTWSELGKPVEILEKAGILEKANQIEEELQTTTNSSFFLPEQNMQYRNNHYKETLDYFEQFIPKSIDTIEDVVDSHEWFQNIRGNNKSVDINFSIKADGFNISLFYYKGHFIAARTRGRSGESLDVTIAMSKVVPMNIDVTETFIRVTVEAVMEKESLPILREMDKSREWKSPRNSIRTLLMNDIGDEFHRFIIPLGIKVDGRRFESRREMFRFMTLNGFKVVNNRTETISSNEELINTIKEFSNMKLIYANDGCVVAVDNFEYYNKFDTSGKYDYAMRAYRLFNWQSNIYCSLVIGIEPSYNTKRISLGLKIIPTTVSNGSTITTLDADNLSRLQNVQVKLGSLVAFHMRSDSCVDWLDRESQIINNCLKSKINLPAPLVQPVAEFEHRMMERYGDKLKERGIDLTEIGLGVVKDKDMGTNKDEN